MATVPPLTALPEPPAPPPAPLWEIFISLAAGLAVAWAVVRAIRKYHTAHGKTLDLPAEFLPGALALAFTYALTRVTLAYSAWATAAADLLLLGASLGFPELQRRRRQRVRGGKAARSGRAAHLGRLAAAAAALSPAERQLSIEIAALQNMLKIDPKNTFCHEKLSELYEKLGKLDLALGAARAAAAQDPTVANRCRVEELEEKAAGAKS
ncbi:MAG: hypothetical protein ACYC2I_09780 [Elusimicrobiales bacterium]